MKNYYNVLSADIQSMAFVVSARRMLVVLWFALLVSSLRCLTGGVSLFEMLITSLFLSLVADVVIASRFGTPWSLLVCYTRIKDYPYASLTGIGVISFVIATRPYLVWLSWPVWRFLCLLLHTLPYLTWLLFVLF